MKNTTFALSAFAALTLAASNLSAGVGVTGPAVRGSGTGIALGDFAAILVSTSGASFSTVSFTAGELLNDVASYGSGFALVQVGSVASSFGTLQFNANFTTELVNGISQGDSFAVITFNDSLNNASGAVAGDTYKIWTNAAWLVPADGSNFTFTTGTVGAANFPTATGAPTLTGVVSAIPEPSSFAALAGLAVVGMAATRRRRSA